MSQEATPLSSDDETKELEGIDNSQEENELVKKNSESSNENEEMKVQNDDKDINDKRNSTEEKEEDIIPTYVYFVNYILCHRENV